MPVGNDIKNLRKLLSDYQAHISKEYGYDSTKSTQNYGSPSKLDAVAKKDAKNLYRTRRNKIKEYSDSIQKQIEALNKQIAESGGSLQAATVSEQIEMAKIQAEFNHVLQHFELPLNKAMHAQNITAVEALTATGFSTFGDKDKRDFATQSRVFRQSLTELQAETAQIEAKRLSILATLQLPDKKTATAKNAAVKGTDDKHPDLIAAKEALAASKMPIADQVKEQVELHKEKLQRNLAEYKLCLLAARQHLMLDRGNLLIEKTPHLPDVKFGLLERSISGKESTVRTLDKDGFLQLLENKDFATVTARIRELEKEQNKIDSDLVHVLGKDAYKDVKAEIEGKVNFDLALQKQQQFVTATNEAMSAWARIVEQGDKAGKVNFTDDGRQKTLAGITTEIDKDVKMAIDRIALLDKSIMEEQKALDSAAEKIKSFKGSSAAPSASDVIFFKQNLA